MKKLLTIGLTVLLTACSGETVEAPKKEEPKPEVVKVDAKKKAEEEAKQKEEAEALAKAEELKTRQEEVGAYATQMGDIFVTFRENMNTFTDLNAQVSDNPMLLLDGDWITQMALSLTLIQISVDQIREVTNVPADMQEVHELTLNVADNWQYIVDNFPSAIDNRDTALLAECAVMIEQGSGYLRQATDLMQTKQDELF